MTFEETQLNDNILDALYDMHFEEMTPIQEKCIPLVLEGRDVMGIAQTGTGKTAAYLLPILSLLDDNNYPDDAINCVIMAPTRELAQQIDQAMEGFSYYLHGVSSIAVYGGNDGGRFDQELKSLRGGAPVVIATPGRLLSHLKVGNLNLARTSFFVLDEADRMLDMGFLPDIKRIISQLPPNKVAEGATANGVDGKMRQSLFFSATLSPEIRELAGELVHDPVQIMISPEAPTVDKIDQKCMLVEKGSKDSLLVHLLESHPQWYRVIVFARTRHGADRVERKLGKANIVAAAIHSDKTQNQRTRALEGFRRGQVRVLVATDIASRGIDVPDVSCVVNMELPLETESYIHRIGRTARAGESGAAISFVTAEERGQLKAVERLIRKTIQIDRDHPYHSEGAERSAGKQGDGLPQAPWVRRGGGHGDQHKQRQKKRRSFKGRRQPDFGQKKDE